MTSKVTELIKSIGRNIKPWHPIVGVAVAELFFRPFFTMMDKKASPETKKYTATREALTEVVAASTYLASNAVAVGIANKLYKNNPEKLVKAKHNLALIGLWTAAAVIIPAVTSLTIKPFMGMIFKNKNNNKKEDAPQEIKIVETQNIARPSTPVQTYQRVNMARFTSTGMRV